MSNETCSAGHEKQYYFFNGEKTYTGYCIHGTPIVQECKEGLQPDNSDRKELIYNFDRGQARELERDGPRPEKDVDFGEMLNNSPLGKILATTSPEKVEGLSAVRLSSIEAWAVAGNSASGDTVKELLDTIRAKDEKLETQGKNIHHYANRATAAEAKVKELEAENERLKPDLENLEFRFYRIMCISEIAHIPESIRLKDMKIIAEASRAEILGTLTPKESPPQKWPGDSSQPPPEGS